MLDILRRIRREVIVEFERWRRWFSGVQQEGRSALDVAVALQRAVVVAVEALQFHASYLVQVLSGGEKDRRFAQVTHAVELATLHHRMVQFIELLAARCCHLALGRASFFVSCFSFGALENDWIEF